MASTLVLLNNKRQVVAAQPNNGGVNFVDTSSLGMPGAFFLLPPIAPAPTPIVEPGCAQFGGSPILLAPAGVGPGGTDVGFCGFDFGNTYLFVPDESRVNGYFRGAHMLTEDIEWITEVSYASNRAERGGSPSFPILTFPTVPAEHPDNFFGVPVSFFGRELGNGQAGDPANTESDTFRFSTMLTGELDDGFWELSFTKAKNDFIFTVRDTIGQNFQYALRGLGGFNCDHATGTLGEGGCEYFNPFSSNFVNPNSQSVIDSFTGRQIIDSKANLEVAEGFISTELFEMDGGAAGLAFGMQYRYQDLFQDYDEISNRDGFSFAIGNPDVYGEQDVYALFGELALPFNDDLDVQLALRYEDYGGTAGDTVDPKVAVSYRASENFSLRGSYSTSFRAFYFPKRRWRDDTKPNG